MISSEFVSYRKELEKTQKKMAQLIGTSVKAVHSYEQGWRTIPTHVERQIYFLISRKRKIKNLKQCWTINNCPSEQKKQCPAWEFNAGKLCWFINGTICDGEPKKNWDEKIAICRTCKVFQSIL